MATLEIKVDTDRFRKQFGEFQRQIPFAISSALNTLAIKSQAKIRGELPRDFTIRSPWVAKGVKVQKGTKRTLEATVGSVDDFMAEQAAGEFQATEKDAIPLVGRGRPRPTKKSKTPKSRWPGSSKWGDVFFGKPKEGWRGRGAFGDRPWAWVYGLWQRRPNRKLRLLYRYEYWEGVKGRRVALQRKWPLPGHVQDVLDSSATLQAFDEAMIHAIATAKKK